MSFKTSMMEKVFISQMRTRANQKDEAIDLLNWSSQRCHHNVSLMDLVISHSALVVIVCSAGVSFANQKAERRQQPPAKSWRLSGRAFACLACTRPWAPVSAS